MKRFLFNTGVSKELALLTSAASLAAAFSRKRSWALPLALLSSGLWVLPRFARKSFSQKVAVVTGGSRGLGLALAKQLVSEGASVMILARDGLELKNAEGILKGHCSEGAEVHSVVCDVTHPDHLENALATTRACFGRIDLFIHNAGSIVVSPFDLISADDFTEELKIHFMAAVHATRLLRPYFRQTGGGTIINISAIGAVVPMPHLAAYNASKFALAGFSETMAAELRQDRIQVLTVYPGLMRTGSLIHAFFKGVQEKEFAWFSASGAAPGLSVPVETASRRILNAAKEGRSEIVIGASLQ